jgi:DNA-binding MarR family transcriptional regulator
MLDLLRAFYWVDEALQTGLRLKGWDNITRSQSLILANITVGVRPASQLARNLGVTRQAISQMLAEMERNGLVQSTSDPTDGRAQIVNFSDKSQSIRDDAMETLLKIEAEVAGRIGKRRFNALAEALQTDWGSTEFMSTED